MSSHVRLRLLLSLAVTASLGACLIGAVALLGWIAGVDELKSVAPGVVTMKFNTALALVVSGAALCVLARPVREVRAERVAAGGMAFVLLLSAAVFSQYLHGHDLGIDELVFAEPAGAVGTIHPGRMAINTSVCFMAVAASALVLRSGRVTWLPPTIGVLVFTTALMALIGYASGVTDLYGISGATQMAIPTATAFLFLALALVVARPDQGPMRLFTSAGVGGSLVRRVVPLAFAGLLVLITLRLLGQEAGLYGTKVGALLSGAGVMLFLIPLIWRVGWSLERSDEERRRVAAALSASERQIREILETAHDAFIAIDGQGRVRAWNAQAEATFGWTRDEMLGRSLTDAIVPERQREPFRRGIERYLATGEAGFLSRRLELPALHREGHVFPVELTISALETDEGCTFNAFVRDITERKRAQRELAEAHDEALEAARAKSMFVANVSHEIRTPINGVIGMTSLLLDTDLDAEQREFAETAAASGEALLEIIDDILDFSKGEAGKLALDVTDFHPRETLEQACRMVAGRADQRGLELVAAIEPDVPWMVRGDAGRLRQVVANFLSNAVKFTSEGEVVLRAGVRERRGECARVRIEVSDTGIGIEQAALAQLFQPFVQADGSTTRRYGGTGLGLAISKQLVELMGGEIGAESRPGRGSTFWVELDLPVVEGAGGPREEGPELHGLAVLVVDDNPTNRTILARQLASWEMRCNAVENAAAALSELGRAASAGDPYRLALIDLNMPDTDGLELAAAIRARAELDGMRLVLLTSSTTRRDELDVTLLDGFLTKPVLQSQLLDEIGRVMAGGGAAGPRERQAAPLPPAAADGPLILVVEDTPVNQTVARSMLARFGYRVELARDGREALALLSRRAFAAVLMDCQMPVLDGYEATREIRRREGRGRRTPIIAMTASSMAGDRERCLAAGMDDYLSKPLRPQQLEAALKRWAPPAPGVEILDESIVAGLDLLDTATFEELRTAYLEEAAAQLAALASALDRGDQGEVARLAHKLKGSSGTLGAAHVASVAGELERRAGTGELAGADPLLDRLGAALEETRDAFVLRLSQNARPSGDRSG